MKRAACSQNACDGHDITHDVLSGETPEGERLRIIELFRHGNLPCLISKASLLGFGLNFQKCGSMIFSGWDDSYERFYQAIRRAYRYGQTQALRVHIPFVPELEGMILENILRKKENFERDAELQERYYREALEGLCSKRSLT
jgi:superfamily II DNA or RNA helicase